MYERERKSEKGLSAYVWSRLRVRTGECRCVWVNFIDINRWEPGLCVFVSAGREFESFGGLYVSIGVYVGVCKWHSWRLADESQDHVYVSVRRGLGKHMFVSVCLLVVCMFDPVCGC